LPRFDGKLKAAAPGGAVEWELLALVAVDAQLQLAQPLHLALDVREEDEEDERQAQLAPCDIRARAGANQTEEVLRHARLARVQTLPLHEQHQQEKHLVAEPVHLQQQPRMPRGHYLPGTAHRH
jgi:hypothetical protein